MSRIFRSSQSSNQFEKKKLIAIKPIEKKELDQDFETERLTTAQIEQIINDANDEAAAIIKKAEAQAKLIEEEVNSSKETWESEKAILIEEAKQAGYNDGKQQGRDDGYADMKHAIDDAKEVIVTAKKHYEEKVFSAEKVILQLGLKVAEKIITHSLENDEQLFQQMVETVLKEVREEREIQIHVHPSYYDLLVSQKDELLNVFPTEVSLYLFPDDELSETDCYIESESGRVDASIDSQLAEIKQKLFEMLESEM